MITFCHIRHAPFLHPFLRTLVSSHHVNLALLSVRRRLRLVDQTKSVSTVYPCSSCAFPTEVVCLSVKDESLFSPLFSGVFYSIQVHRFSEKEERMVWQWQHPPHSGLVQSISVTFMIFECPNDEPSTQHLRQPCQF